MLSFFFSENWLVDKPSNFSVEVSGTKYEHIVEVSVDSQRRASPEKDTISLTREQPHEHSSG
jgi:hypothetical protein